MPAEPKKVITLGGQYHLATALFLPIHKDLPKSGLIIFMEMQFRLVDQDERAGPPAVQELAHEQDDLLLAAAQLGKVVDVAALGLDDQFGSMPIQTFRPSKKRAKACA